MSKDDVPDWANAGALTRFEASAAPIMAIGRRSLSRPLRSGRLRARHSAGRVYNALPASQK